jgi:hypothetical protein
MAILNQEVMITHPLKFLIVPDGCRHLFYIEWVHYHAIFVFSLAHEMLKLVIRVYHHPIFHIRRSSFIQTVQTCTTRIYMAQEVLTHLILGDTSLPQGCTRLPPPYLTPSRKIMLNHKYDGNTHLT